ncbi:DEAD-domain-containing protein [Trichoderma citrinoviride]|uniref:ATP-dependent RNA helicase n=1 Tax=Trichoderma citrinoviride TaxID=58853 RepID=A0A2T4BMS6_9HYPO|nr:DEAD-domain-containing protein [Trichoderma citrinoviride]PTB70624.1 DEAD-domain-containing protein [Trichoderma citrinoviride]
MFRTGIRRCGALARVATTSTKLLSARAAFPASFSGAASVSRSVAPLKSFAQFNRLYSADAAVAEENTPENAAPVGEITSFRDLEAIGVHRNLLDAITQDMRYDTMTPVQAKTITPALKGTDIVAQAKTGTGKTIAFLLPLLQRMIAEDPTLATRKASRTARSDDIRGIVLSPTRELAEQIATEARRLCRRTGLVVQSAVGGTQKSAMLRQTQRQGCHLLVATPGRLNDLLEDPNSGIDAPKLAALVLDEADRMLDVGFEKELNAIQSYLPKDKVRQTILVSATIPDNVIQLARKMVRPHDFEFVQTIPENDTLTHDRIPQHVVTVSSWANVFPSLFELVDREVAAAKEDPTVPPFKAIVYFNTTSMVELAGELGYQRRQSGQLRIPTFAIQSQLSQQQRTKAADMFRNSRSGILFSSDVTARGMDFPNVTHVIQVDAPRERESYIHRLGRTGRQDKGGEGWLFIPPMSANPARKLLRGLPLKPNKTLESAEVDLNAVEELPAYHEETKTLIQAIPRKMLAGAYTSLFGGQVSDREHLVEDLNDWAVKGWGWPEPPAVSSSWARNQGLMNAGLNIQDGHHERMHRDERRGGDRFGDRRGDRRGGGRFDRRGGGASQDPFSEMKQRARRDGPPQQHSRGRGRRGGGFESSW